jgi:formylglycine-generating enzyme required for sulfatase activity
MTSIHRLRITPGRTLLCASLAASFGALLVRAGDDAPNAPPPRELQELLARFSAELVQITPGTASFPKTFEMGSPDGPKSEQPMHTVKFDYSFAIAKYEVPQNLFEAVTGANPSRWVGPRNSVEMISRAEASAFCAKLTMLLRKASLIDVGEEIRLPSEAEWEYCCRAGTNTAYSFGPTATAPGDQGVRASILDRFGWHTGNAAGNDPPVGALEPNQWGLYDMHGYLREYVADAWHDDYRGAPADGSTWQSADLQPKAVVRGGSWRDRYDLLKSSSRQPHPWTERSDAVGFRCVKAAVRNGKR